MNNFVELQISGVAFNVRFDDMQARIVDMVQIIAQSGPEIIDHDQHVHIGAAHQTINDVRADKTSAPRNQNIFSHT